MAKIDRVEDLPDWFDLDKYQLCKSFAAVDWLSNLETRRSIFELIALGDGEATKRAEYLRDDPIDNLLYCFGGGPANPVRSLRYADLATRASFDILLDPFLSKNNGLWAKIIEHMTTGNFFPSSELGTPIGSDCLDTYPILVDLRASDSILIDAFATWLRDARSEIAIDSKRERPAYKYWARYGLLPYLDLRIWSKETGHSIPHHVMAEAVGYRKGGDSFRKTVPPLAKRLMADLSNLEALAAIEGNPEE
ncbi:DUF6387 family protein [Haliea sp. E1-2-M8]|uniref:DUF6387 family protein n=1 Tax=Haliea sp. E1-2-M8 TaxID=3064706 RepID=UPI0027280804|nr:DUF6387 family protein [Haliea sp. E1-2-M8]MDO8863706.1 DUF6387 family protein [Haliea sp. E1-2-M8]